MKASQPLFEIKPLHLGSLTRNVSGYRAIMNERTKEIILQTYIEVPFQEQWILENKEVMASIREGMKQSFNNETSHKGSFICCTFNVKRTTLYDNLHKIIDS